jgi:hypothetical protein
MHTPTLKSLLLRYLKDRPDEFIASGELQRYTAFETKYTPRTAVRRLEELREEGTIGVEYRKGHAFYRYVPSVYEVFHRQMQMI